MVDEIAQYETPEELATEVASRLVAVLREGQAQGRSPSVALTGGTIAEKIHRAVVEDPDADQVAWDDVHFWFGDERYVAAGDADRNALQAREAMLDRLPVDPAKVHEMPAADGPHGGDLDAAAAAYAQELRTHETDRFDVVFLGVGPDGHVASLFPGFWQLDVGDDVAVAVRDSPKPPPERVSLTFPALERSREVWFVVAGDAKADAVRRALAPGTDWHDTPAARPRGQERTLWLLDAEAASAL